MRKQTTTEKALKIFFLFILFISINAFDFKDNPPSGWYQQFLPDIGGTSINDMQFLDSLNGYMVTSLNTNPDNGYILKTIDGGDNWQVIFIQTPARFSRVKFINDSTGFVSGKGGPSGTPALYITTNKGATWVLLPQTGNVYWEDMAVINNDTIFVVDKNGLNGGVYRTTNGGLNWTQQLFLGSQNPTHIYFYNKDIGFTAGSTLYKTTNSGVNWVNTGQTSFTDMQFINESTGWKCYGPIQKTTDGGFNWVTLSLPPEGGNLIFSRVYNLHVLNKDTIWGVGAAKLVGTGARGLIYISTNGGQVWGYQLPDTLIHSNQYTSIQFIGKNKGWAYWETSGVRTLYGGSDTTVIVSVAQTTSQILSSFILHQNYPNPFNPNTAIAYQISKAGFIGIKVYDIRGKEIAALLNERKSEGSYEINFNGSNLTSGIYFYSLSIDNKIVETKKMMLIK